MSEQLALLNDRQSDRGKPRGHPEGDGAEGQPLPVYLQEIRRVPLLSAEREVALAQAAEAGRAAEEELRQERYAGVKERQRLEQKVRAGHKAREELVVANLRLVVSVARRYANRGVPLSDLIQEGNIGLLRAVERFDWRRGFKFSTYATWWIRQAVTRALADDARAIRLPVHVVDKLNRLTRALGELPQRLGREPTAEEIGTELDLPAKQVSELLQVLPQPISLESPTGEDREGLVGDFLEDVASPTIDELAQRTLLREELAAALDPLTPRERRVIQLRYGLDGDRDRSLAEVGVALGITRERIRQIEAAALRKLRHPARSRGLRAYAS